MTLPEPRKFIKTIEIEFEGYRLGVYGPRNVLICKWAQSFNEACDAPRSPWIDPQGKLVVYNKGHKRYSNEVQYHMLTAEPGDWIFYNKEIGFKVLSDAAVRRTLKEKDPAVKPGDFVLSSGEHAKVYVGPLGADFEKDRSKFSDIGFMDLLKIYNNGLYGKINKTVENTLKGCNKVSADNAIFIQKNSLGKVVAQPGFMSTDNLPDPDVAMAKEIFDTVEDALSANQEAANATEYGFQIHIDWTKK